MASPTETSETTTKDRLLEAAVEVIDSKGLGAIRVRDIAAVAGVREPSVYHYFGSRDGLIEAALAARYSRGLMQVVNGLAAAAAKCITREEFIQVIRQVVATIVEPTRAYVRSVRADVLGSAQTRPGVADVVMAAQRESNMGIGDIIKAAQGKGWVRSDIDPLAFAVWYVGMVNGRILLEMDPAQVNPEHWNDIALDASLHLLFGTSALNM